MQAYRTPDNLKVTPAAARVSAGLTQEEAAGRLRIAKSTLIDWELGRRSPTVTQAVEMSTLYGRPLNSIRLAFTVTFL